jgi:hypothetical protein
VDDVRMDDDDVAMAPLPNLSWRRVSMLASISSSQAVLDSGHPRMWMSYAFITASSSSAGLGHLDTPLGF